MSEIAIHVDHISKQFKIGQRERYSALRDVLARAHSMPLHVLRRLARSRGEQETPHIWALKDVTFEIARGDVVGFVGRNGAGKSTLLKILARITKPTLGTATIAGRVASLLEVGSGFHTELTGRENVYLNAAVLGMRKREIDRKLDAIVAFAGVERFLDTHLKHYSSGMQMRLAFSVAAHLEPEILLIDEVLAVGDAEFQKKCLGRMGDISRGGRTIIFVSHQLNQVRRLCSKAIWLDAGEIRQVGTVTDVLGAYETATSSGDWDETRAEVRSFHGARFTRWEVTSPVGSHPNALSSFDPVTIKFYLDVTKPLTRGLHGIHLLSMEGHVVWGAAIYNIDLGPGQHAFTYRLPSLPLRPGAYYWRVTLYDQGGELDDWSCVPELQVDTQPHTHPDDRWSGVLNFPFDFETDEGRLTSH